MQDVAAESEVRAVIEAYRDASYAGDPDQYVALFSDDAVQCAPGRTPTVGRAALLESIAQMYAARSGASTLELAVEHCDIVGDIAIVIARAKTTVPTPTDRSALLVLRRVDGRWLIWRQAVTLRG